MGPDGWDALDDLKREMGLLPRKKEILLRPEAILTVEQAVAKAKKVFDKVMRKNKKHVPL